MDNQMEEPTIPDDAHGLVVHFADEHIAVVDKPAGLFAVPAKGAETDPSRADCVVARVRTMFPDASGPIAVHRLDLETSGLMVVGLTKPAHRSLSRQFENRLVAKTYTALLQGHVTPDTGAIDLPLIADWPNRPRQIIDFVVGKPARTLFSVIDRTEAEFHNLSMSVTRIRFHPLTGRSHQLRVHAAAPCEVRRDDYSTLAQEAEKNPKLRTDNPIVGTALDTHAPRHLRNASTLPGGLACPIVGDSLYNTRDGTAAAPRMMLHASRLAFFHPVTGERITITSNAAF
ncbi:MAG: RluA family pseudouridine synthase [Phycisphaeraceae bacterium]|nr:RluA family pseudouridine synthase [Phycisphaerales bacterium]MCB9859911.1 RluA family pseudouridine synthase [Phycisphaeraceae bacterium]